MKKNFAIIFCALVIAGSFFGCGEKAKPPVVPAAPVLPDDGTIEFAISQLAGTDALGREILPNGGSNGKYVGLFWTPYSSETGDTSIGDIEKLLGEYGRIEDWIAEHGYSEASIKEYYKNHPVFNRSAGNTVVPEGLNCWAGEPLYGYYSNLDPWVLKRQLALLGFMDVDYLLVDLSNYPHYFPESLNALLTAVAEMKKEGNKVPSVSLMLSPNPLYAEEMLAGCWTRFINKKAYEDCWFRGDEKINPSGNPMIAGGWLTVDRTLWDGRVWLKETQWPTSPDNDDGLPWMDWNTYQHNYNGIMSVSTSQHLGGVWSSTAYLYRENGRNYQARGWTYGDTTTGYDKDKVLRGANFEQQWDYAIAQGDELYMVVVTGWNEWTARKMYTYEPGTESSEYAPFVDVFDMACSRAVEMMDGGFGDNYTFLMAKKIREFKGKTAGGVAYTAENQKTTIDITEPEQWNVVKNRYMNYTGVISERNWKTGKTELVYRDATNRNEIAYLKIANDSDSLYVCVSCVSDITAYTQGDGGWMNLYISTGAAGGWEGYNYLVNAKPGANGEAAVSALSADANGAKVLGTAKTARYYVSGKSIVFKVALSDLGAKGEAVIQIKAADNVAGEGAFKVKGTADDFYITGNCAPAGRFNYAYKIA